MEHPLPDAAIEPESDAVLDLVDSEEDDDEPENATLSEDERLQTAVTDLADGF